MLNSQPADSLWTLTQSDRSLTGSEGSRVHSDFMDNMLAKQSGLIAEPLQRAVEASTVEGQLLGPPDLLQLLVTCDQSRIRT